ncbi:MAG: DsrE family protein [Candidatus Geothermarchaeales archaeon]
MRETGILGRVITTKIGIVLSTNDPETAWNAIRFGVSSLRKRHSVRVFLLGKGVEIEDLDGGTFDILTRLEDYIRAGGEILACGTCLKIRNKSGSRVCPISGLSDMLAIVEDSDRLLTFG